PVIARILFIGQFDNLLFDYWGFECKGTAFFWIVQILEANFFDIGAVSPRQRVERPSIITQ
ncbi:MAG: hypothetical protein MR787_00635, partial [Bacteroidales bacterium]|nr:hypothetical protein [Bacteroidales bacterium]